MKNLLMFCMLACLLALATPTPASAQLHVGLHINIGPPAPPEHEEVIVRPRGEVVWIAGYYRWRPHRHEYLWVRGHWAHPPRPHSVWVPGRWEKRNGEYVYYEGRWEHGRVRR